MTIPHTSVLLEEILNTLKNTEINIFVDATIGAGGHSEAILQNHPEVKLLIGIDQDPSALQIAKDRLQPWQHKIKLIHDNFSNVGHHLKKLHLHAVSGILIDLGVSSMQLDQPDRGFSFSRPGPLDMRMNPKNLLTASDIINTWSESELGKIFREFGEEKQWRKAARLIVDARSKKPIETTQQLVEVLTPMMHWKKKGINPLTLIFQAIRIAVNNELQVLSQTLPEAIDFLEKSGKLLVISFHSLEDRIVKNVFRHAASDKENTVGMEGLFLSKDPDVKLLTRKPITPSEKEEKANPRSRSAKLRTVEKL